MFSAGVTAILFSTLAGLLAVTSEFRYGTIRPTLLVQPRRRVVLGAKLAAAALVGVLFAVACVAVAFAAGRAILAVRGVDVALHGGDLAAAHARHRPRRRAGRADRRRGRRADPQPGGRDRGRGRLRVRGRRRAVRRRAGGRALPARQGRRRARRPARSRTCWRPGAGAAVLAAWTLAFVVAATWRTDHTDV